MPKPERKSSIGTAIERKTSIGKKQTYACSTCGIFSDHTMNGHTKALNNLMSFDYLDLCSYVRSTFIPRIRARDDCYLSDPEMDTLILEKPSPPRGRARTAYAKILSSVGRNFVALLTHSSAIIKSRHMSAEAVFKWANLISEGAQWEEDEAPPDHVFLEEDEEEVPVMNLQPMPMPLVVVPPMPPVVVPPMPTAVVPPMPTAVVPLPAAAPTTIISRPKLLRTPVNGASQVIPLQIEIKVTIDDSSRESDSRPPKKICPVPPTVKDEEPIEEVPFD